MSGCPTHLQQTALEVHPEAVTGPLAGELFLGVRDDGGGV